MEPTEDAAWSDFLTASELGPFSAERFGERMAAFDGTPPPVHPWQRTGPAAPLPQPRSRLATLLRRRVSARRFGDGEMTAGDLAALFGVLAQQPGGGRGHASGGGLNAVGAAAALWRVDHPLRGRVVWHDPVAHALHPLGPAPAWSAERTEFGGLDAESPPAVAIMLYGDPDRTTAKYGDRGARFLLLEAGAILQSLGLLLAERRLAGYVTGGGYDQRMLALAGLSGTSARYLATVMAGTPAASQRSARARP